MCVDFAIKLVAQDDYVLEGVRSVQRFGLWSVVPDLGFAQEIETGHSHESAGCTVFVGAEEDRRAEDALKCRHQSPVLFSALMHPEGVQHLRCASKLHYRALLSNGKRGKKDWNNAVLAVGNAKLRVTRDLQDEVTVFPFVEQLARRQPSDRQSTQDERTGREAQVLVVLFSLELDNADPLRLVQLLLREDEIRVSKRSMEPALTSPVFRAERIRYEFC